MGILAFSLAMTAVLIVCGSHFGSLWGGIDEATSWIPLLIYGIGAGVGVASLGLGATLIRDRRLIEAEEVSTSFLQCSAVIISLLIAVGIFLCEQRRIKNEFLKSHTFRCSSKPT